ncbi:MAG: Gfo/Idh/MocA family oxidoreductase [Gordonia sp. (in: high G+C Gram-positive bacteria)]
MSADTRTTVGVIGAGSVSETYLQTLTSITDIEVRWVADCDQERAAARARQFGVNIWGEVSRLLADHPVDAVVNLTPPRAHADITVQALDSGAHVWSEKPLAVSEEGLRQVLAAKKRTGLAIGCAPDTILSPAISAGVRAVRNGSIGRPIHALAIFQTPGPDLWHPHPEAFFQPGAGPLLDMGPYYVSVLIHALGTPIRVLGQGVRARDERIALSAHPSRSFPVAVDTHITAQLWFADNAVATVVLSWDSPSRREGILEITGDAGTVCFPDPNDFTGNAELIDWREQRSTIADEPATFTTRGAGLVDMLDAVRSGRPSVVGGAHGVRVARTLLSILHSAQVGYPIDISDTVANIH